MTGKRKICVPGHLMSQTILQTLKIWQNKLKLPQKFVSTYSFKYLYFQGAKVSTCLIQPVRMFLRAMCCCRIFMVILWENRSVSAVRKKPEELLYVTFKDSLYVCNLISHIKLVTLVLFLRHLLSNNYAINNDRYLLNVNHVLGPILRITNILSFRAWIILWFSSLADDLYLLH